jgi:hypothetical protein
LKIFPIFETIQLKIIIDNFEVLNNDIKQMGLGEISIFFRGFFWFFELDFAV